MFEQLVIRHAQDDDVEAIAHLSTRTFRDTFAADNTPSDIEAYLRDSFSIERTRVEFMDSNNTFLLAFVDNTKDPLGYAKLRIGKQVMSVKDPNPIEIERLYVDKAAIGKGVGAALMQRCLNEAVTLEHQTVWLGVWEQNTRAIAFYKRWGFEAVGTHIFTLGSDQQNDLILQRFVDISR